MNDALIAWLVSAGFISILAGAMSASSYNRYSVRNKDSRLFARVAVLSPLWPVAFLALIGWAVWHLPRAIKYAFSEGHNYDEGGN